MHVNHRAEFIRWLPGILLGIVFTQLIYAWLVYQGTFVWFWYNAMALSVIGAVLGYSVTRDTFGVYNGLRAGKWIRFLVWAVIGWFVVGTMGLLAKSSTPLEYAPLLPDSRLMIWFSWGAVGALISILGIGQDYRQLSSPKKNEGERPA